MANAAIDELKAYIDPMTDAAMAVKAIVDTILEQVEEATDNPDEITDIVAAFRAQSDALVEAALNGTPTEVPQ